MVSQMTKTRFILLRKRETVLENKRVQRPNCSPRRASDQVSGVAFEQRQLSLGSQNAARNVRCSEAEMTLMMPQLQCGHSHLEMVPTPVGDPPLRTLPKSVDFIFQDRRSSVFQAQLFEAFRDPGAFRFVVLDHLHVFVSWLALLSLSSLPPFLFWSLPGPFV